MQSVMLSNHAANVEVEDSPVTHNLTPTSQRAFETYIDQSQFRSPDVEKRQDVEMLNDAGSASSHDASSFDTLPGW